MKEQATRLWGWIRRHRGWVSVMLIVLLVCLGTAMFLEAYLNRFGPPPPVGQDCGWIVHRHDFLKPTTRADATLQPLACFWQAYQTCQAARIRQSDVETDAAGTDTLTIERRGDHCALYGQEEDQVNTDTRSKTFLCTSLSKAGESLQVSDCDGNEPFTLDPRDAPYESYPCGIVGSSHPIVEPQRAELCFFTAYQRCLADELDYDTLENGQEVRRSFYIDNHCGLAYWHGTLYQPGAKLASCTSLVMQDDGLHFSQCGTDGDIFVPLVPSS